MKRQKRLKKVIVGVTGIFGCGKTTVAGFFRTLGAKVINADRIGHSYLSCGTDTYRKIVRVFGEDILKKGASIDRQKLAGLVFSDRRKLNQLNRIMLPVISRDIKSRVKNIKNGVVVLDAPLLFEAKLDSIADYIVVVNCSRKNLLKRLMKLKRVTKSQALSRIKKQIPLSKKLRTADFIIDNNLAPKRVKSQVKGILEEVVFSVR